MHPSKPTQKKYESDERGGKRIKTKREKQNEYCNLAKYCPATWEAWWKEGMGRYRDATFEGAAVSGRGGQDGVVNRAG